MPLPPTPANIKAVKQQKAAIERAIALGKFDYLEHFPNSKHARALSPRPANGLLANDVMDEWLATVDRQVQPETRADYDEYLRNIWKPYFAGKYIVDVTNVAVTEWINKQTVSVKRIKNVLTPLHQTLRYAVTKGYIPVDPIKGIEIQRADELNEEDVIDPFTVDEIRAIVPHLEEPVGNMIEFWSWTGLREGELFALTWKDWDLKRGVIRIDRASREGRIKKPKTPAGVREVVLLPPALAALERQKRHTRLLHRQIFLNPGHRYAHTGPNGTVYGALKPSSVNQPWGDYKALRRRWAKACKAAGVRYRFPRQLRHTYASWMLNGGEAPIWVSRQMGHKNLRETLDTYTRFIADMNRDGGMKAVAALWTPSSKL